MCMKYLAWTSLLASKSYSSVSEIKEIRHMAKLIPWNMDGMACSKTNMWKFVRSYSASRVIILDLLSW